MSEKQVLIVEAVRAHAEQLLNSSPRFKLFTLHGSPHISNLFQIADIFVGGGIRLTADEAYLLSLSICVHDLGMVVGLKDHEITALLKGKSEASEPAMVENEIRESHHTMVDLYIEKNLNFMVGLGATPSDLNQVSEISKCHRKVVLQKQHGAIQYLGALLRVIDELDIGPERAPLALLRNQYYEMDATSVWHWVKHNIVETWIPEHNVSFHVKNGKKAIEFSLITHPADLKSIPYWNYQIRRPIIKALQDDGCAQIISDRFGVRISLLTAEGNSSASALGAEWKAIEDKALSGGRQVVLLIDDEVRKMEDLMLPITRFAHVIYAFNAEDAFAKIAAIPVALAIVDMQISGAGLWSATETEDYKTTGIHIIRKIKEQHPHVRIGVLTATKYDVSGLKQFALAFSLRKPCSSNMFVQEVQNALR